MDFEAINLFFRVTRTEPEANRVYTLSTVEGEKRSRSGWGATGFRKTPTPGEGKSTPCQELRLQNHYLKDLGIARTETLKAVGRS
jgi:hypothetical protein